MFTYFAIIIFGLCTQSLLAMEEGTSLSGKSEEVDISLKNKQKKELEFQNLCQDLAALSIGDPTKVKLSTLRNLKLSDQKIKNLSRYIEDTVKLRSILIPYFDSAKTSVINAFPIKKWQLRSLDISNNKISKLPSELGGLLSLTTLNVSHNRLKELPITIGQLLGLKKLYLDHNPDLKELPSTITNLTNLRTLKLGEVVKNDIDCALTCLPEGLEKLPKLNDESKKGLAILRTKFEHDKKKQPIKKRATKFFEKKNSETKG